MARGKQNNENKEVLSVNLGMEYMGKLTDSYVEGNLRKEILELMDFIAEQFKCKARIEYKEQWDNDAEERRKLDTDAKYIPKAYRNEENKDDYTSYTITIQRFNIDTWKIENYDDKVVKQYVGLTKDTIDYMEEAGLRFGKNEKYKFGNSGITGTNGDWLFWNDGNKQNFWDNSNKQKKGTDSWHTYLNNDSQHWVKAFFSITLAMYVCSDGINVVWKKRGEGVREVSHELIERIKKETENLIQDMGIKEPPSIFFSSAKNLLCLLLTAFCFESAMTDEEKEGRRKKLLNYVMGEGSDIYDYRENLWKEVAIKNELPDVADTLISDYYVLPALVVDSEKKTADTTVRFKLEAPIGYGKTTFYRALLTLMLRSNIDLKSYIDEDTSIENVMASLDSLEEQIGRYLKNMDLSNYFPIYVNALLINDKDDCKDILELAEGNDYADLIRHYVQDDAGSKALLIVDGLDEVNDSKQRKTLAKLIDSFIKKYENVNYIVSTRPIDLSNYKSEQNVGKFLSGIQKVTIQSLNDDQKKAIIKKWVSVLVSGKNAEAHSNEIERRIEGSPYFSDLSCNPYMLAGSVQLMINKADLKQYTIISMIVDNLIEKKLHSFLENDLDINNRAIRRVLSCLAYNCVIGNASSFERNALTTYYRTAYITVADTIKLAQDDVRIWSNAFKEINTKAGLIVYDEDTKKYHWQSETLELFLAAEWALLEFQHLIMKNGEEGAVMPIREHLDELRNNERWEDIFIMLLVRWDADNSEFSRTAFRSAIRIIIRYLLDLSISLETELIRSIGRIMLCSCLENYAECSADIRGGGSDEDKKKNIKLMLRFINQNAKVIADSDAVRECNNKYIVEYTQLYEEDII